ncbi:cyclic nucleotide-binding domain-containing protein [Streptomyces sp. NPDC048172]|uniref:cyclic nucleotide-binding domain-containing protein n=1 Tax=Streptomyces sp. NPDC048172 TaxID=3365505 RepID=UPI0037241924
MNHEERGIPTITRSRLLATLPEGHGERLLGLAREVTFPAGSRVFHEGGKADRFWILRSGMVALEAHVPGRRDQVIETLGRGELLGWSWLLEPYAWHLGARAVNRTHAYEFDAAEVRRLCARDPVLGQALALHVVGVVARRLQAARTRLLDLYGPSGTAGAG